MGLEFDATSRRGSANPMWSYVSLYACDSEELLDVEGWFERRPIREEYLIVDGGKLAGAGAHSYSAGDATRGAEAAVKF